METKRKMPSKIKILNYWKRKYSNFEELDINTCWSCGFESNLERCHLHDRTYSFNDDVSNLVLLCRDCHKIQESMCKTKKERLEYINKLINSSFLMNYRINSILLKIKNNIYDSTLIKLGYNKKQIKEVKSLITY